MKICSRCGETKSFDEFYGRTDGQPQAHCRDCVRQRMREYGANPENARRKSERAKARRLENLEAEREKDRVRVARERDRRVPYLREYYRTHKQAHAEYMRAYVQSNKAKLRASRRAYDTTQRRENSRYVVDHRVARALLHAIGKRKAGRRWEDLLGFTLTDLMSHLERQFAPDMDWTNLGDWHIDHVVPRSAFRYVEPEDMEFRVCWSLENLRPMWGVDNIEKRDTLPDRSEIPHALAERLRELERVLPGLEWVWQNE